MIKEFENKENLIYSKLANLQSKKLRNELDLYIEYLLFKQKEQQKLIKEREFGCGKGMFEMSPDFDEPLDDFKDYMI